MSTLAKICLVIFLFCLVLAIREAKIVCPKGNICELVGQKVQIEGRVISIASERRELTTIVLKVEKIIRQSGGANIDDSDKFEGNILIKFPHTQFDFFYGDQIIFKTKLKAPARGSPEDNFSYALYLAGQNIYTTVDYPQILAVNKNSELSWSDNLFRQILFLREKIRQIVNHNLSEPEASIMNAMLIGDQTGIPQEIRKDFSRSGIVHILSVSGTHITLFLGLMVFFWSKIFSRKSFIFLLSAGGVIFYLIITGAPACAVRAGIMGLLAFLAVSSGYLADYKTLFWLSLAILSILNPLTLLSDIGFQLSFLAIWGMIFISPLLEKFFFRGREGRSWNLMRIFLLSLSISLTTGPLVMYYFGVLSVISFLANIILLPLFAILLPAGFLLIALGLLEEIIIWLHYFWLIFLWQKALNFLGLFLHFIFGLNQTIIVWLLKFPHSFWEQPIKIGPLIFFYAGLLLIYLGARKHYFTGILPRQAKFFASQKFLNQKNQEKFLFLKIRRRFYLNKWIGFLQKLFLILKKIFKLSLNKLNWLDRAFALVVGGFLLLAGAYFYSSSRPFSLTMLNVGQGDALLLNWPCYHLQILIDAGPGRQILSALGQNLPFYDRKIEITVLSHPHQDHLEGMINLLDRYTISRFYLASLPSFDSPELLKIFWEKIAKKNNFNGHYQVQIVKREQKIIFSEHNNRVADLQFITPLFDYTQNKIRDLNDQSVILKLDFPEKVLFMGDATKKLEKILLSPAGKYCNIPLDRASLRADTLKIGHHGSRFSTSEEFLEVVEPKEALISVGKNFFGHPAKETLQKLKKYNVEIHRSDGILP